MLNSLKTKELEALIHVSKTIIAHLDLDTALELIMSVTTDVMKVEASSLFLIDDETGELLFHIARGEKADIVKPIRMKQGKGIVGSVIQSGKAKFVNDVSLDPKFYNKIDGVSGFKTRSILCVPLATTSKILGAIEVLNKLDGSDFNDLDLTLCEAIASQSAISIENAMLHKQIIKTERLAAMGQTIAGLSHCIKNVLYGIQGGSYMVDLGMRKNNSTTITKGWEIVKKNSAFMQDLVMDMLTYSKEREPEYEMVDINEIIESVCTMIATKASEKGVNIIWTPNSFLGKILLDANGIRRCLLNLISNAVDACEQQKEGRVDVSTDVINDNMCSITILDNGCGICEEDREKLFQIFFSTKGSKGTGLGLAVTHKIITEHDGTIDVGSEVGQGTKFTIKLPMRKEIDIPTYKINKDSQV